MICKGIPLLSLPLLMLLLLGAVNAHWDGKDNRTDIVATVSFPVDSDSQWGKWGTWNFCPKHKWVSAYDVKMDYGGTAVNGIKMFCSCKRHRLRSHMVTPIISLEGGYGKFSERLGYCSTHYTSITLSWQKYQGWFGTSVDDHGAVEIDMHCPTDSVPRNVEKHKKVKDVRHPKRSCPPNSAVCGLSTMVESSGEGDRVGLNNLRFVCCRLPS